MLTQKNNQRPKPFLGPKFPIQPRTYQINNRETTSSTNPVYLGPAISSNKRFF